MPRRRCQRGNIWRLAQKFTIETDAGRARALGRAELATYLAMQNYTNHWLRLGFTPADLEGSGSNRLVDALVNWGSTEDVKRQVRTA